MNKSLCRAFLIFFLSLISITVIGQSLESRRFKALTVQACKRTATHDIMHYAYDELIFNKDSVLVISTYKKEGMVTTVDVSEETYPYQIKGNGECYIKGYRFELLKIKNNSLLTTTRREKEGYNEETVFEEVQ